MKRCIELHRRRRPWFLREPAGMVVAAFSWGIMITSMFSIWFSMSSWLGVNSLLGVVEGALLSASIVMCMWSHFMVMTTDPGVVPLKKEDLNSKVGTDADVVSTRKDSTSEEEMEMSLADFENQEDDGSFLVFCDACNLYRPTRAMHCDTCERCVILMDHHCPWVNNCVGAGNQKFFLLFLFYVAATSVHVLMVIALQRWTCQSGQAFCGFEAGQFPGRLGMWLLAASCAFGLFSIVMLVMEVYGIDDDTIYSTIAKQLHVRAGCKSRSRVERHLSVVFGTNGFDSSWFLPLPHKRSRLDWQVIAGYGSSSKNDEDHC